MFEEEMERNKSFQKMKSKGFPGYSAEWEMIG